MVNNLPKGPTPAIARGFRRLFMNDSLLARIVFHVPESKFNLQRGIACKNATRDCSIRSLDHPLYFPNVRGKMCSSPPKLIANCTTGTLSTLNVAPKVAMMCHEAEAAAATALPHPPPTTTAIEHWRAFRGYIMQANLVSLSLGLDVARWIARCGLMRAVQFYGPSPPTGLFAISLAGRDVMEDNDDSSVISFLSRLLNQQRHLNETVLHWRGKFRETVDSSNVWNICGSSMR